MNLETLCKELRIGGVHSYIQEYYPDRPDIEEIFISALQAEQEKRKVNRQMRALRQAGFPTMKRFEDLVGENLPEDGKHAVPGLRNLGFISERRNVILIGNAGTGKTHLAISTGVLACEAGYRVLFRTAAGLINEMIEARHENRLTLYLRQFKKIDLLILDELGYVSFDLAAAELLFQLLATRYETMSTIITSNLSFSEWVKVFHDPALTGAILDRITQNAIILNMNGKSYRREKKA
ncbi:IS21-like element helper ATPase IstB [Methanocalculus sp.]|uniref:IS21-like element helper ATPase IstB n=1 Tax=Methanocalculus sp. TaxID=2004547 RepID=UPI00179C208D|nr:IS21-like element helper ATPase IstB [Methanocalculus sp.]HIJ05878.1 ATP-binding protein [Methanocalculus sp.]